MHLPVGPSDVLAVRESAPHESVCAYGLENASFWRALGWSSALAFILALSLSAGFLLATCLLYIPFSYPGVSAAAALVPLAFDQITMRWVTWDYFGPGDEYVEGVTGNRLRFYLLVFETVLNKVANLVVAIYCTIHVLKSDGEGDLIPAGPLRKPRAVVGLVASQIISAAVTHHAYTKGIPSVWRGSDGDTLNGGTCSGSEAWPQMSGFVRFSEISFVLGPIVFVVFAVFLGMNSGGYGLERLLPFLVALVEFSISVVVIVQERNAFHRSTAVYNIVFSFFGLLGTFNAGAPTVHVEMGESI